MCMEHPLWCTAKECITVPFNLTKGLGNIQSKIFDIQKIPFAFQSQFARYMDTKQGYKKHVQTLTLILYEYNLVPHIWGMRPIQYNQTYLLSLLVYIQYHNGLFSEPVTVSLSWESCNGSTLAGAFVNKHRAVVVLGKAMTSLIEVSSARSITRRSMP